uniref:Bcl-2 Bcl-2 homology region 1-3 domain-containing protein n=1 Tax=Neogobius melanostomus TaxID=47308 RepID=A0A8C6TXQ4_9GOBI
MEEELKDVATEDVPSLSPLVHQGQTDQEKIIVYQVSKLIKTIGNNSDLQVAYKVFEDQITWERIALLFIAAGRLAVRLVEARLPQTILEFAKWVMDFFRQRLVVSAECKSLNSKVFIGLWKLSEAIVCVDMFIQLYCGSYLFTL